MSDYEPLVEVGDVVKLDAEVIGAYSRITTVMIGRTEVNIRHDDGVELGLVRKKHVIEVGQIYEVRSPTITWTRYKVLAIDDNGSGNIVCRKWSSDFELTYCGVDPNFIFFKPENLVTE